MLRLVALLLLLAGCTATGGSDEAILRGDEAFATGDVTEALAEYRLALGRGDRSANVLLRTAHAYALSGRIDEARDHYREAIEQEPELVDLAVSDLLRVARRATERRDGVGAASAVEAAMELQPGVSLTGSSLPLARHFAQAGRYGEALPFFQKAVAESEGDPVVVFEMALALEELGDCRRALVYFEQVRDDVSVGQRSELDWHMGNCSVDLAAQAQEDEDLEEALRLYRVMIDLGEPRNRLATAWFQTGEILAERGECTAARQAFEQVQSEDLAGALSDRARSREDDIRFRRSGEGPC